MSLIYLESINMNMNMEKIGRYAFLLGLVISLVAGFINIGIYGALGLFVLGVIVGFLNVTGKEVQGFLLGTVALLLAFSSLTMFVTLPGGATIVAIAGSFVAFVAGGALIVALKTVYEVTSSK